MIRARRIILAIAVPALVALASAARADEPPPAERNRCVFLCPKATATPKPVVAPASPAPAPTTPASSPPEPAAPVAQPSTRPPTTLTGREPAELLRLINAHRASHGLRAVALDAELSAIARAHTAAMIAANRLFHNEPLFSRESHHLLRIGTFGENVGYGYSVSDNHEGFLASLHHHENVDGASFVLAGLAVARSADGRIWVTEDFGSARRGVAPPAAARTAPLARPPAQVADPRRPTRAVPATGPVRSATPSTRPAGSPSANVLVGARAQSAGNRTDHEALRPAVGRPRDVPAPTTAGTRVLAGMLLGTVAAGHLTLRRSAPARWRRCRIR